MKFGKNDVNSVDILQNLSKDQELILVLAGVSSDESSKSPRSLRRFLSSQHFAHVLHFISEFL